MWENPILKKVWEVGKKKTVLMKKHYKNGLMLGVFLLAMFFLGRSIGAIAYGLRMQREIKTQATAGTALENTEALLFAENWGLGFGSEGTQPSGTASSDKLKEYNAYYVGDAGEKKIYLTFDCGYENGNTSQILDALKKHNAPATFFVVGHFLESAPEIVKRMVEDGRDCSEVLIQLSAVKSAINNTGKIILQDHIEHCIVDAVEHGDRDAIKELEKAIDRFMK